MSLVISTMAMENPGDWCICLYKYLNLKCSPDRLKGGQLLETLYSQPACAYKWKQTSWKIDKCPISYKMTILLMTFSSRGHFFILPQYKFMQKSRVQKNIKYFISWSMDQINDGWLSIHKIKRWCYSVFWFLVFPDIYPPSLVSIKRGQPE